MRKLFGKIEEWCQRGISSANNFTLGLMVGGVAGSCGAAGADLLLRLLANWLSGLLS